MFKTIWREPFMNPVICICCGEPITEEAASSLRNPNVCVFCTSLLDGIDLTRLPIEPAAVENAIARAQQARATAPGPKG
jgi:hypothetical protein